MIDTGNDGFDRPKRKQQPEAEAGLAEPTGSPTWPIVLDFAKRMEAKLEKNRHKGDREGWLADDIDDLLERLREELCELDNAICDTHGNTADAWMAKQIANEAADVANFAMFIADWYLHRAQSGNDQAQRAPD